MKRIKRIAALLGAVLLIGLYVATLVLALIGSPTAQNMLMAAIVCTVLISVLFYAMMLIARVLGHSDDETSGSQKQEHEKSGKKRK